MNRKVYGSILAGALIGASIAGADILVDDFQTPNGTNVLGGNWLADSDGWPAIGGSSKVLVVGDTSDLVLGEGCGSGCYAGHNIFKAYVEDGDATVLSSDILVTKDVSAEKKWAYAGWVMNFTPEFAKGGKPAWELLPHEKGNEVDISSCETIEMDLKFDLDRQLWIALYNPWIEKDSPTSPQYGWRYKGTGAWETRKFKLAAGGLTGIGTKWQDPKAAPLDLKKVTRLQVFYEGQAKLEVKEPAPYTATKHNLSIKRVNLTGANCQVVGKDSLGNVKNYGTTGIRNAAASRIGSDLQVNAAAGRLQFSGAAAANTLDVTVRDVAGQVVARGTVDALRSALDVSALRTGVYTVQAVSGAKAYASTVTLLK